MAEILDPDLSAGVPLQKHITDGAKKDKHYFEVPGRMFSVTIGTHVVSGVGSGDCTGENTLRRERIHVLFPSETWA